MKVPVDSIVVKNRIREEIGDLRNLKRSMEKHGLLNPIIVNENMELIAGFRRLQAAKELGWEYVEVKVIEGLTALDKLEIELEENIVRKDLTHQEVEKGIELKKKMIKKPWWVRFFKGVGSFFKKLFSVFKRKKD